MSVDKIILRALVSTLGAIVALFAFMIIMLVSVYPSTMMEITYDLGMDSSSVRYAERAYKRSNDVYYMAYATEVAIGIDDYKKVESCGCKLIENVGFAQYCNEQDVLAEGIPQMQGSSYEQFIYSQVCVAKYKNGKQEEAVDYAFSLIGNAFPKNNAVVAVVLTAKKNNDMVTLGKIKEKMEQKQGEVSEADKETFDGIFALVSGENG